MMTKPVTPDRAWLARRLVIMLAALPLASALAGSFQDAQRARIDVIQRTALSEPARALVKFDSMLSEPAIKADTPSLLDVELARCWLLADTKPALVSAALDRIERMPAASAVPGALAKLRLCQGYAHERSGKPAQALIAYDAGVEAGTRLRDDELLAKARVLRGEQRAIQGRYGDAIEDLKAAYDLELRSGKENNINYALNALANLYADRNVKDYANAMKTYERLLASHVRRADVQGQATAHFNIGSTFESQGELAAALPNFRKAMELDRSRGAKTDTAYDMRAVGIVLSKMGRHDEALAMIEQSLQHYVAVKDADGVAMLRLTKGTAHRRAARHELAAADLEAAKAYYAGKDNPRFLEKAYEELALVAAATKRWDRAFELRGEHMLLQQKLQKGMLDERLSRLRVQFQTEQAVLQSQLLASENEQAKRELAAGRSVAQWQAAALALSVVAIAILGFSVFQQLRQARRMLDLALTDELTRLPNRRHFMAVALSAFEHAAKNNASVSLAAIDIDHFKQANDTYGHAAGDQVLQRAAHAMRCALRPGDTLGRTGGEEFLVVLPGAGSAEAAHAADRIRLAVAAVDCSDIGAGLELRISIGVAELRHNETLDSALGRADAALYSAKHNGRNRVVVS
ncbi:MAG: tetratricopeptide repeat-containing diguanylate cyclase [Pseudomonadota bacterium]